MNLTERSKKLQDILQRRKSALDRHKKECLAFTLAEEHATAALQAQDIAQRVAQTIQQNLHQKIAGVVSKCLLAVFGEDAYEFEIHFERKRGKTEAQLSFLRNGRDHDPSFAAGGGVLDVAAFALRIGCLLLTQSPTPRRTFICDEPFKHLSSGYRNNVSAMMESLSQELGIQFIMVTHSDELKIGKVIEL